MDIYDPESPTEDDPEDKIEAIPTPTATDSSSQGKEFVLDLDSVPLPSGDAPPPPPSAAVSPLIDDDSEVRQVKKKKKKKKKKKYRDEEDFYEAGDAGESAFYQPPPASMIPPPPPAGPPPPPAVPPPPPSVPPPPPSVPPTVPTQIFTPILPPAPLPDSPHTNPPSPTVAAVPLGTPDQEKQRSEDVAPPEEDSPSLAKKLLSKALGNVNKKDRGSSPSATEESSAGETPVSSPMLGKLKFSLKPAGHTKLQKVSFQIKPKKSTVMTAEEEEEEEAAVKVEAAKDEEPAVLPVRFKKSMTELFRPDLKSQEEPDIASIMMQGNQSTIAMQAAALLEKARAEKAAEAASKKSSSEEDRSADRSDRHRRGRRDERDSWRGRREDVKYSRDRYRGDDRDGRERRDRRDEREDRRSRKERSNRSEEKENKSKTEDSDRRKSKRSDSEERVQDGDKNANKTGGELEGQKSTSSVNEKDVAMKSASAMDSDKCASADFRTSSGVSETQRDKDADVHTVEHITTVDTSSRDVKDHIIPASSDRSLMQAEMVDRNFHREETKGISPTSRSQEGSDAITFKLNEGKSCKDSQHSEDEDDHIKGKENTEPEIEKSKSSLPVEGNDKCQSKISGSDSMRRQEKAESVSDKDKERSYQKRDKSDSPDKERGRRQRDRSRSRSRERARDSRKIQASRSDSREQGKSRRQRDRSDSRDRDVRRRRNRSRSRSREKEETRRRNRSRSGSREKDRDTRREKEQDRIRRRRSRSRSQEVNDTGRRRKRSRSVSREKEVSREGRYKSKDKDREKGKKEREEVQREETEQLDTSSSSMQADSVASDESREINRESKDRDSSEISEKHMKSTVDASSESDRRDKIKQSDRDGKGMEEPNVLRDDQRDSVGSPENNSGPKDTKSGKHSQRDQSEEEFSRLKQDVHKPKLDEKLDSSSRRDQSLSPVRNEKRSKRDRRAQSSDSDSEIVNRRRSRSPERKQPSHSRRHLPGSEGSVERERAPMRRRSRSTERRTVRKQDNDSDEEWFRRHAKDWSRDQARRHYKRRNRREDSDSDDEKKTLSRASRSEKSDKSSNFSLKEERDSPDVGISRSDKTGSSSGKPVVEASMNFDLSDILLPGEAPPPPPVKPEGKIVDSEIVTEGTHLEGSTSDKGEEDMDISSSDIEEEGKSSPHSEPKETVTGHSQPVAADRAVPKTTEPPKPGKKDERTKKMQTEKISFSLKSGKGAKLKPTQRVDDLDDEAADSGRKLFLPMEEDIAALSSSDTQTALDSVLEKIRSKLEPKSELESTKSSSKEKERHSKKSKSEGASEMSSHRKKHYDRESEESDTRHKRREEKTNKDISDSRPVAEEEAVGLKTSELDAKDEFTDRSHKDDKMSQDHSLKGASSHSPEDEKPRGRLFKYEPLWELEREEKKKAISSLQPAIVEAKPPFAKSHRQVIQLATLGLDYGSSSEEDSEGSQHKSPFKLSSQRRSRFSGVPSPLAASDNGAKEQRVERENSATGDMPESGTGAPSGLTSLASAVNAETVSKKSLTVTVPESEEAPGMYSPSSLSPVHSENSRNSELETAHAEGVSGKETRSDRRKTERDSSVKIEVPVSSKDGSGVLHLSGHSVPSENLSPKDTFITENQAKKDIERFTDAKSKLSLAVSKADEDAATPGSFLPGKMSLPVMKSLSFPESSAENPDSLTPTLDEKPAPGTPDTLRSGSSSQSSSSTEATKRKRPSRFDQMSSSSSSSSSSPLSKEASRSRPPIETVVAVKPSAAKPTPLSPGNTTGSKQSNVGKIQIVIGRKVAPLKESPLALDSEEAAPAMAARPEEGFPVQVITGTRKPAEDEPSELIWPECRAVAAKEAESAARGEESSEEEEEEEEESSSDSEASEEDVSESEKASSDGEDSPKDTNLKSRTGRRKDSEDHSRRDRSASRDRRDDSSNRRRRDDSRERGRQDEHDRRRRREEDEKQRHRSDSDDRRKREREREEERRRREREKEREREREREKQRRERERERRHQERDRAQEEDRRRRRRDSRDRSPDRGRGRSPERIREKSPDRRNSSPSRNRDQSPNRSRNWSPDRNRNRSPQRGWNRSPDRSRDRSPERRRVWSPQRNRDRSPALRQTPDRIRDQSLDRTRMRSPQRNRDWSPVRRRPQSPDRIGDRSPAQSRNRSPERGRGFSPERRRDWSPVRRDQASERLRGSARDYAREWSPDKGRDWDSEKTIAQERRWSRSPDGWRGRSPEWNRERAQSGDTDSIRDKSGNRAWDARDRSPDPRWERARDGSRDRSPVQDWDRGRNRVPDRQRDQDQGRFRRFSPDRRRDRSPNMSPGRSRLRDRRDSRDRDRSPNLSPGRSHPRDRRDSRDRPRDSSWDRSHRAEGRGRDRSPGRARSGSFDNSLDRRERAERGRRWSRSPTPSRDREQSHKKTEERSSSDVRTDVRATRDLERLAGDIQGYASDSSNSQAALPGAPPAAYPADQAVPVPPHDPAYAAHPLPPDHVLSQYPEGYVEGAPWPPGGYGPPPDPAGIQMLQQQYQTMGYPPEQALAFAQHYMYTHPPPGHPPPVMIDPSHPPHLPPPGYPAHFPPGLPVPPGPPPGYVHGPPPHMEFPPHPPHPGYGPEVTYSHPYPEGVAVPGPDSQFPYESVAEMEAHLRAEMHPDPREAALFGDLPSARRPRSKRVRSAEKTGDAAADMDRVQTASNSAEPSFETSAYAEPDFEASATQPISDAKEAVSSTISDKDKDQDKLQRDGEEVVSSTNSAEVTESPVKEEQSSSSEPRPLKVKSRWRRNSEAEAIVDSSSPSTTPPPPLSKRLQERALRDMEQAEGQESTPPPPPPRKRLRLEAEAEQNQEEEKAGDSYPVFEEITENIHLTERKKSKSMKRMVCDCTTSKADRAMGIPACGSDCLNRMLMIECGSRCPCFDYCTNKRFQKKQYAKTEAFNAGPGKGWGLRAAEDLPDPGAFVMEYVGELLGYKEFVRRTRQYAKQGMKHHYFMALNADEVIDATQKGSTSRFMNHSCDPNCETQKWTVNGELRVGFFTKKPVTCHEELTFDYQFEFYGEPQKCYCGARNCRGFIGSIKNQPVQNKKVEKRKADLFEDEMLDEDIESMRQLKDGMKNKNHVLEICRLMVRAEKPEHRLSILGIIQDTNEIGLRLFLGYHGLPLLWSWMVDVGLGDAEEDRNLRREMLSVLKKLPITNRTILKESKIMTIVEKWANLPPPPPPAPPAAETEAGLEAEMEGDPEADSVMEPLPLPVPPDRPVVSILAWKKDSKDKAGKKRVTFADETASSDSDVSDSLRVSSTNGDGNGEGQVTTTESPLVKFSLGDEQSKPSTSEGKENADLEKTESGDGEQQETGAMETEDSSDAGKQEGPQTRRRSSRRAQKLPAVIDVGEGRALRRRGRRSNSAEERSEVVDSTSQNLDAPELKAKDGSAEETPGEGVSASAGEGGEPGSAGEKVGDAEPATQEAGIADSLAAAAEESATEALETQTLTSEAVPSAESDSTSGIVPPTQPTEEEDAALKNNEEEASPTGDESPPAEENDQALMESMESRDLGPMDDISTMAADLLSGWSELKELYKIPKKQRVEERKRAERELESVVFKEPEGRQEPDPYAKWKVKKADKPKKRETEEEEARKRTLLPTPAGPKLTKEERRQLFEAQVKAEDELAAERAEMQRQQMEAFLQQQAAFLYQDPAFAAMHGLTPDPNLLAAHGQALDPNMPFNPGMLTPAQQQAAMLLVSQGVVGDEAAVAAQQILSQQSLYQEPFQQMPGVYPPGQAGQVYQNPALPPQQQQQLALQQMAMQQMAAMQQTGVPGVEEDDVPPPPSPPKASASNLPPNWKTARDAEGRLYYYHTVTRQTQWETPAWERNSPEDMDFDLPDPETEEEKRRKMTTTAAADTSSEVAKKIKEQFRRQMSQFIVVYLNPYRKPDCKIGRIVSTEDFKHLARKLTHHVMAKELKHCRHVEDLEVNENVKAKAKDYVKKYMSRFGSEFKTSSSPQLDDFGL